jgi:hypothetical protein
MLLGASALPNYSLRLPPNFSFPTLEPRYRTVGASFAPGTMDRVMMDSRTAPYTPSSKSYSRGSNFGERYKRTGGLQVIGIGR